MTYRRSSDGGTRQQRGVGWIAAAQPAQLPSGLDAASYPPATGFARASAVRRAWLGQHVAIVIEGGRPGSALTLEVSNAYDLYGD